ncbi:MAG: hypothetical protein LBQ06_01375, partial [Frankiaceae bacterium]|nr:hypothetical protein [Frankiaceae bacterium]
MLSTVTNRLHGLALLIMVALTMLPEVDRPGDGSMLLRVGLAVIYLGVGLDIQRRGPRRAHLVPLGACLLACGAMQTLLATGDTSGLFGLMAFSLSAARVLSWRRYAAAMAGAAVLYFSTRLAAAAPVERSADDFLLTVVMTFSAVGFMKLVEAAGARQQAADAQRIAQSAALEEQGAKNRAAGLARRV